MRKFVVPVLFLFLCGIAGVGLFFGVHTARAAAHHSQYSCFGESCDNLISVPEGCNIGQADKNAKTVFDSRGVAIGVLHIFFSNSNGCNTWWGALDNNGTQTYINNSVQTVSTGPAGTDFETYEGAGACTPHISPGHWCSAGMQGSNTGLCYHAHSVITDEYGVTGITTNTLTFCV